MNELQYLEEKAKSNGHSHLIADSYGEDLSLDDLRERAVDLGINLHTPSMIRRIEDTRLRAQQQAAESNRTSAERFYLRVRKWSQIIANSLILLVTITISYLLLPLSVFGLGVAEYSRVSAGIAQFDSARAHLMSMVAVSTYALLLFIKAQETTRANTRNEFAWSFRLVAQRVQYLFGMGQWQPKQKTTLDMLKATIKFLTGMILLLGTVGALQSEIAVYDQVTWGTAVKQMLLDSDLPTFLNLAGGLLLTMALLSAQHFVTMLTYERYTALVPEGTQDFLLGHGGYSEEQDRAEALYLLTLIRRAEHRD